MTTPASELWPRRAVFCIAALAIIVNLIIALQGALPTTNQNVMDDTTQSDLGALGANLGFGLLDMGSALDSMADVEPSAGEADDVEIATTEPEYFGDGDIPEQPKGLGLEEVKIPKMETFDQLNDVLELLRQRREYLIEQEDRIIFREQILTEREKNLAEGLQRLEQLREEIDALIEKKSEDEERELARIVKVYEGMKAKKAAQIFNSLDTEVLIDVARRMREAKFASIMQSMDPKRAEQITEKLAEQARLPDAVQPQTQ